MTLWYATHKRVIGAAAGITIASLASFQLAAAMYHRSVETQGCARDALRMSHQCHQRRQRHQEYPAVERGEKRAVEYTTRSR